MFASLFADNRYTNQQYKCYCGANLPTAFPTKFHVYILNFFLRRTISVPKQMGRKNIDICPCNAVTSPTNYIWNVYEDIPSLYCKIDWVLGKL